MALCGLLVLVLAQGVVYAHRIPVRLSRAAQKRLDRGRKQQPVIKGRLARTGTLHLFDEQTLRFAIQLVPQLLGRAQDCLCEECRIHDGLLAALEVHAVARCGIDRHAQRLSRQRAPGKARFFFIRVLGGMRQPGSQPGHRAAKRLQIGVFAPVEGTGMMLDGHGRREPPFAQIFQHGTDNFRQAVQPELPRVTHGKTSFQ